MTDQPLSGVKVLDFSTLLPGPLAGLILTEAGAEVIKIERPGGEDSRRAPPAWGPDSAKCALLNAGKKSLVIDLKAPGAKETLEPLIREADVVIEQFRPGVMARLGLGYAELSALNPGLIYCSITGYGQTGPRAARAGHDLNYLSETGVLALNPGPEGAPQVPPVLAADIAGGSYPAVINILLALQQRARTGQGAHLDIAMSDNLFPFAFWALAAGWAGGAWPGRADHVLTGGTPRYRLYPTRDGRLAAVAAIEDKFWFRFCDAVGLAEPLQAASADPAAVIEAVAALIAVQPAAHWAGVFEAADCCCSIVASLEEAVADAHFRERGLFAYEIADGQGAALPALPVPVSPNFRQPQDAVRVAAAAGAHTDELTS